MSLKNNKPKNSNAAMPVIAASYIGPALTPNHDAIWEESKLPLNTDNLINEIMGQPMRRAGRFIKMVACGGLACLQRVSLYYLKGKKTGIFLLFFLLDLLAELLLLPWIKNIRRASRRGKNI